jgi:precorrin-6B methylase 2
MLGALALPEGSHVVDLGAGYGRLGLVIAEACPKLRFTGFEISPERVAEARRVYALQGLDPGQMREADLSSPEFVPPAAQAYLIYDFGTRPAVEKVLRDLQTLARGQSFQVIGRGRLSRDLIERHHPWLSQVHPPRHMGNFSIYSG